MAREPDVPQKSSPADEHFHRGDPLVPRPPSSPPDPLREQQHSAGQHPTSLANCSSLKVLWLNNNGLDGQIPADLPPNLQQLQLSTNDIGGTIPPSIANATALRKLSCAFNRIEGRIPDELAELGGLEILYLGSNLLAGMFPPAILNLSSLTGLGLNTNMLSGEVPSDLGNSLPNLQILSLAQNLFHGKLPHSFVNASSLRVLDISTNNFTGVVPSSIGRLSKLVKLNIETNKVQARNKQEWDFVSSLANCTELQGLSLASVVPHWLGAFKFLQKLSLSTNMFTGNIPSSLSNLSQLIELLLDTNQFIGHIPISLGNLQSLETLSVSSNKLHGRVPEGIFSISTIREIGLSSNNLDGQLPAEVGNAKQLVILLLSANKLSGDIPSTMGACKSLEDIELDSNIFSGNIPVSFGNLFGLKVLNLSYNNLTGSVPASIGNLQHLEQLDLLFNHLEGKVPVHGIFKNATATHIDGNQGLCGGASNLHLPSCSVMSSYLSKHRLPVILKVAIPLACMLSLLATVIFVQLWRRKNRMRSSMSSLSFDSKSPQVSYKDLARATDGFSVSNLIGTGRYSSVYRGKILQEENVVAVKVFCLEVRGAQRSFIAECNALRNVRHRNLVRILTACSSIGSSGNDFKALVYEFMPGGDLHNLLYSTEDNGSSLKQVSLAQRLSIVVDIADAMAYLHHNHHGSIVHCDLKPSNILLDNDMVAHVGDFGLARLQVYPMSSSFYGSTSVSSLAIRGTIGYVAPEYGAGGQVSTAVDVYSFGVILLEIFIRKSLTNGMFKDGLIIAKFAEVNIPNKMMQIVDPQLVQELDLCEEAPSAEDNGVHCLLSVLNVGLCCTKSTPSERISMDEVSGRLHRIRDAYIGG
ncbi:unnamed protein product [Triticum turgidum subsp. durum]|uniref:Receptor kinase-like protein Xa21 n=1 Tax=Triticum turgidum subsp. durum TaxID=4567 RepID=A0A9R0SF56_TRITD|nr:unnamed protein product [Triticum turgidum subsp. durum]